jgi:hypothetical protein
LPFIEEVARPEASCSPATRSRLPETALAGDPVMFPADEIGLFPFDEEVSELSVLLSSQQAQALEQAAHERGLTTAQMLRRLVQDFLNRGHRPLQEAEPRFASRWA